MIIDKIAIDNQVYQTEAANVYGTGSWTGSAITPGFNRTEFLHANGYFLYQRQVAPIDFAGFTWLRTSTTSGNDAYLDFSNGQSLLTVAGGSDSDSVIYDEFAIDPNSQYEFSVDAYREQLSGTIQFDRQPWVTTGVDLFDSDGNLLSKQEVQLFGPTDPNGNTLRAKTFFTPANAAYASVWVWAQQTDADIPVRIRDIGIEQISNNDTTPPTIELLGSPITSPANSIQLTLRITDPSGIIPVNEPGFDIQVSGPNGFFAETSGIAGSPINNGLLEFYEIPGSISSANNGEYFVTANAGRYSDSIGNRNPTLNLGSFIISIDDAAVD